MTLESILHLLRNPYGHPEGTLRQSRLEAAEMLEKLSKQLAAPTPGEQALKLIDPVWNESRVPPLRYPTAQLAAPADLVRRLLADHQRVEPHHADQCALCREAQAAIEGQPAQKRQWVEHDCPHCGGYSAQCSDQPAQGERKPDDAKLHQTARFLAALKAKPTDA